ncbi:MAG: thiamine diphosphokinase [Chloroflexales bacterium]|nr:thiamine diphosphokinase [Chloroflexales bacterium]
MYTIIVANSPIFDAAPFAALLRAADLVIAADGGGNALYIIRFAPHLVVGDLDSLNVTVEAWFAAAGVEIQQYPAEKDETDLELALLSAVERGATRLDILGALGGRWDQSLSNVALLALPELNGCRVRLLDVDQEAYLVRDAAEILGDPGDIVSLLPVGGAAYGVTTKGLQYPLHDATLYYERSRGVSNVLAASPGRVSLCSGQLLLIRSFSNQAPTALQ